MSDSYRTQREDRVAVRRGAKVPRLRIVETAPYPGDVHPLSKIEIERFLKKLPEGVTYGLRSIELRARNHRVGSPFACYRGRDRSILLYSLPREWKCRFSFSALIDEVKEYGAVVKPTKPTPTIVWTRLKDLKRWYSYDVLAHDVAHHFRRHFLHKNGHLGREWEEERVVDQPVERFWTFVRQRTKAAKN
jgi:hypothetical protein